MTIHMTGDEARAIREKLGWTQDHMGHAIGLSGKHVRQNYWQYEAGMRRLSYAQAHLIRAIDLGYRPSEHERPDDA